MFAHIVSKVCEENIQILILFFKDAQAVCAVIWVLYCIISNQLCEMIEK